MQLLEQLNLADSLANYSRPTQRPTQHNFSSYTEPKKEQSFLSDVTSKLKMGTASLLPNLFLISSKPKFLSKMFLLIPFLCELAKLAF